MMAGFNRTIVDPVEELRAACADAGSQAAWADRHAISPSYVNDVLNGRRAPGEAISDALGLSRVTEYAKWTPSVAAADDTNARQALKHLEQQWMVLKDQYSEIARALGFDGDAFYGDPRASHDEIVARAADPQRHAGPDLLAALKPLLEQSQKQRGRTYRPSIDEMAEAAIAKAETRP